jgi:hypothetical protein
MDPDISLEALFFSARSSCRFPAGKIGSRKGDIRIETDTGRVGPKDVARKKVSGK